MAEFLPVADAVFDNACLVSCLDHMIDYHRAIDEAWRILKPGGRLFAQSLVWTARADVMHDHLHFHHFREPEFVGAFAAFRIDALERRPWKDDTHRSSLYLAAVKP